jgi:hypothetical protein
MNVISINEMMIGYAEEILAGSHGKEKSRTIAEKLVTGFLTHEEVINFDRAKNLGLNVIDHEKYLDVWGIFREWLGEYLLKSTDKHIIRYIIPEKEGKGGEVNES